MYDIYLYSRRTSSSLYRVRFQKGSVACAGGAGSHERNLLLKCHVSLAGWKGYQVVDSQGIKYTTTWQRRNPVQKRRRRPDLKDTFFFMVRTSLDLKKVKAMLVSKLLKTGSASPAHSSLEL